MELDTQARIAIHVDLINSNTTILEEIRSLNAMISALIRSKRETD